ncbi:aldo/keto reductase [Ruania alba]|uniref:D-threo-aldose 1-dehydrogenase n=1 Tax=Ruania alba TaxID=648782 RepID=A0A1H5MAH9_9MICO|nr:aldo/keto reductase [Ruania alba]SEE86326.1 D-threo-aldose 1-dehydrogenase [Ruania alba]
MHTREIRAQSGSLDLTEIGFGAAGLGNLYQAIDDEAAQATVDAAWDGGIRYFDTAPHYGLGLSERRLGTGLAGRPRDEYVLSTKVGRLLVPRLPTAAVDDEMFDVPGDLTREWGYDRDSVRRSLDSSLVRLGMDHVDIALVHDPDVSDVPDALDQGVRALLELREAGVVRAVGVGTNDAATAAVALERYDIDTVMLAGRYTLLRNDGFDRVAAAAGDRRVVLAGVFNSGILARETVPTDATFDYFPADPQVLERARAMAQTAAAHGATLPQLAVEHPLRRPEVASVVLGMQTAAEVTANVALRDRPPFTAWDQLEL